MIRRRVRVLLPLVLCLAIAAPTPSFAYMEFTAQLVNGQVVALRWPDVPVTWFATDRGVPGVSPNDFQAAVANAFNTWQSVPTATITFQFAGFTTAEPFEDDGMSVLGFQNQPEMEGVLGATGFVFDQVTGMIVEADTFFNSAFGWSVDGAQPGRFDLQSVATHEIGHFLGLGHSALGETQLRSDGGRRVLASGAVMFPISFGPGQTQDRQLQPDDIAGVSDIYPAAGYRASTGAARGQVTLNGQPLFGAHVVAFNAATGALIGGFTVTENGDFEITGLTPGPHVIRVEPLDDADIDSFFENTSAVNINFQVTFLDSLFIAPRGGVGDRFTVSVRPK